MSDLSFLCKTAKNSIVDALCHQWEQALYNFNVNVHSFCLGSALAIAQTLCQVTFHEDTWDFEMAIYWFWLSFQTMPGLYFPKCVLTPTWNISSWCKLGMRTEQCFWSLHCFFFSYWRFVSLKDFLTPLVCVMSRLSESVSDELDENITPLLSAINISYPRDLYYHSK